MGKRHKVQIECMEERINFWRKWCEDEKKWHDADKEYMENWHKVRIESMENRHKVGMESMENRLEQAREWHKEDMERVERNHKQQNAFLLQNLERTNKDLAVCAHIPLKHCLFAYTSVE